MFRIQKGLTRSTRVFLRHLNRHRIIARRLVRCFVTRRFDDFHDSRIVVRHGRRPGAQWLQSVGAANSPATGTVDCATVVVAGAVSVTKWTLAPDKVAYVFAIRLSESGGVPATITEAWVHFDNGFGGGCEYRAAQLGQNRLAAMRPSRFS